MCREARSRFRLVISACLLLCLPLTACSDDEVDNHWQLEDLSDWQREDMGGPPGSLYTYYGRVGERLVFAESTPHTVEAHGATAFSYSLAQGWRRELGFAPLPPDANWYIFDQIVELDGAHYYFDERTPALYKSTNQAQTWREVSLPEPIVNYMDDRVSDAEFGDNLSTDGHALYLVEHVDDGGNSSDPAKLWRSTDGAETWSVVRDDLDNGTLSTADGIATIFSRSIRERKLEYSLDGGDTWQAGEGSHDPGDTRWHRYQDDYLFPVDRSVVSPDIEVGRATPDAAIEWISVEGAPSAIRQIAVVGDAVFAGTGDGKLGRLTEDLQRFEPIPLPNGEPLEAGRRTRWMYALDTGTLAVVTDTGLWQTSNAGQSWQFVGHPYSSVDFVAEGRDALVAGRRGRLFVQTDGDWVQQTPAIDEESLLGAVGCSGELFVAGDPGTSLYTFDAESGETELIWRDERASDVAESTDYSAMPQTKCVHDQFYLGAGGNAGWMRGVSPVSEDPFYEQVGGGLFMRAGDSFERIDDGFPRDEPPSVQSLAYYDGALWVLTARYGVWRVDPESHAWSLAHDGLPTDDLGNWNLPRNLYAGPQGLFAHSHENVWQYRDGRWRELTDDAFRQEASIEAEDYLDEQTISGLTGIDGGLLIATTGGLYVMEPVSGEYMALDTEFDVPVIGARNVAGRIYVRLWMGGLVQYTKQF